MKFDRILIKPYLNGYKIRLKKIIKCYLKESCQNHFKILRNFYEILYLVEKSNGKIEKVFLCIG